MPARGVVPPASSVHLEVGACTHAGKVRPANEDAYVVCRTRRILERLSSNLAESLLPASVEETGTIMMIADGMGGHAAGEVASHTALATIIKLTLDASRGVLRFDDPATREAEIEEVWKRAREYVASIHEVVRRAAATNPDLSGMGTTFTGAYAKGADLFIAHVGDSRAYLFREGKVTRITRDHTLAQGYADMGLIEPADVQKHRLSHVLTQAVGGPSSSIDADLHAVRLAHGDRVLLCTDGLSNLVDETAMAAILKSATSSQVACDAFIETGLERGAPDNITVIVAAVTIEPEA
jgi:protein phosphatase